MSLGLAIFYVLELDDYAPATVLLLPSHERCDTAPSSDWREGQVLACAAEVLPRGGFKRPALLLHGPALPVLNPPPVRCPHTSHAVHGPGGSDDLRCGACGAPHPWMTS